MAIAALVTMTPKDGKRQELEDALEEILAKVRTEPGNILAMTLRDPQQPDKVFEFAIFRDQEAIDEHWRQPHSVEGTPVMEALQEHKYEARRWEVVGWPADKLVEAGA